MSSDRDAIQTAYDDLDAARAKVAALSYDALTHPELLALLDRRERASRCDHALGHQIIGRLAAEATPKALGGTSLADVLSTRMRISRTQARRRIDEALDLGPRRTLTGAPLDPVLPTTAAAHTRGDIGAEHLAIIRRFFHQLPHWVDHGTREQAETTLGRIAAGLGPDQLRQAADRLALLLDQDGEAPDDTETARKRFLTLGRQGADGMTAIHGLLDPEARAALDAALATWAAPGMCNPESEVPCVDDTPDPDVAEKAPRSQRQRNHDGLKAILRAMLASGQLGQHNGLPATIIVSTTLAELESGQGHAVTGGGTLLPMADVIRLAAHAHHYLAIFDEHTHLPLYLGRSKRIASPGQRIVLHATDVGCTFPGCTVPGYGCQVHHAVIDWANGGMTDITNETLACPPHNRLVEENGWTTRKRKDGRTEWIPPPHLDWGHLPLAGDGQPRINDYHRPQNYLIEPDDDEDPG